MTSPIPSVEGPRVRFRQINRIKQRTVALGVAVLTVGALLPALLAAAPAASAEHNGLALTPPMGFNDWNAYKCDVSASLIEQTADAMVADGMRAAGYDYVNIDDCWLASSRDAQGDLVADPAKFPDGIRAVADYVHARGLKLGIYEDAGTETCAGYPGSLGHETQDAATFASWDVDYVKYDQCNIPFQDWPGRTHEQIDRMLYTRMSNALAATGRPIVFSMCNGTDPQAYPWTWGAPVSDLWRTTGDIQDNYGSMLSNVAQNSKLAAYAGPGAWNDPDMLEIGNGGMTATEYRSEFSLWAEMAAPLISGTTLTDASPGTLSILENRRVIAVDQDSLGRQGTVLSSAGGRYVFAKPLADGSVAVALFNSTDSAARIGTTAQAAGLPDATGYRLQNLWAGAGSDSDSSGAVSAFVQPHATVLYRVDASGTATAPATDLSVTASANPVDTGRTATVVTSLRDEGTAALDDVSTALSAPAGWTLTRVGDGAAGSVAGASSTQVVYRATAPSTAPALSTATFVGTASWTADGAAHSARSPFQVTLASPVTAPLATANTTGRAAQAGHADSTLAVRAAGAGLNPQTTSHGRTTAASNQYAAVYRPASAGTSSVVRTVVTGQQDTGSRHEESGLVVRDDMTAPAGSPQGVVLFVSGSGTVGMAWAAKGGRVLDTAAPNTSPALDYPVHLKLVRDGTTYTGYWSRNGSAWVRLASASLPAAAAQQDAGVFHTSGNAYEASTGHFAGLVVS